MPEWLQWLPEWLIPPPEWRGEDSYIWWFILVIALIPSAVLAIRAISNLFRWEGGFAQTYEESRREGRRREIALYEEKGWQLPDEPSGADDAQ